MGGRLGVNVIKKYIVWNSQQINKNYFKYSFERDLRNVTDTFDH